VETWNSAKESSNALETILPLASIVRRRIETNGALSFLHLFDSTATPSFHSMSNSLPIVSVVAITGGATAKKSAGSKKIQRHYIEHNFFPGVLVGWCRQREKIDWQESRKFDCRLVRTIFIFCCPSSIFTRLWPENQTLIPDWTNFHNGLTLVQGKGRENAKRNRKNGGGTEQVERGTSQQ